MLDDSNKGNYVAPTRRRAIKCEVGHLILFDFAFLTTGSKTGIFLDVLREDGDLLRLSWGPRPTVMTGGISSLTSGLTYTLCRRLVRSKQTI